MNFFTKNTPDEKDVSEFLEKYDKKIRNCWDYGVEYSTCKSFQGRFHQYFIFGEQVDCSGLKEMEDLCWECSHKFNVTACSKLLELQEAQKELRLKNHNANDVWTRRSEPPEAWSAPLPDWFTESHKHSYLNKTSSPLYQERSYCSIM